MSLSVRGANGAIDIAGDCIAGVNYPRIKLTFGAEGAATDVSASNPLPVSIISGGGGSSGGLTNTELRASPVAVSGTFWQATQPISGTVSVSGSVAVTGTFWQATQPVSIAATVAVSGPLTDTQLRATPVPVSGTFFQATQPVSAASLPLPSGAATETTLAAINTKTLAAGQATMANSSPVVIASNQSAVPVSGTFWQATQPISGTVTANVNGTVPVSGTFWQATQPVSIAATVATRDLKDNARTQFSAATVIGGVTCVTTEALLSMVPVRAGVAGGGATSIAVTSGKTLRLTAIIFSSRSTSAAVLSARCALRMNPNGAVTASSPILAIASTTQQAAALAEAGDTCVVSLPDGIEISGTQQVGLSQVCSATTGVVYATLVGFEY